MPNASAITCARRPVPRIDVDRCARHPIALVILPWFEPRRRKASGVTLCNRDASGTLHLCRDVSNGPRFAECLAAWVNDAYRVGRAVEDHAGYFA